MTTVGIEAHTPALWPRFILFPACALLGHIAMILTWTEQTLWMRVASILFLTVAWYCVSGCIHEMGHLSIFKNQRISVWMGRLVGFILVIPFTCFRTTHFYHHAKMNTPDDYELWPYSKPKFSITFRRIFAFLDLTIAVVTATIIYGRIFWRRDSPLSAEERRAVRWEYVGSIAFWCLVTAGIYALVETHVIARPDLTWWWFAPLVLASNWNTLRKMTEHVGLASTKPMYGTRTVVPSNPLSRLVSYANFDLNVHGPHHQNGKAKAYELPKVLETAIKREPECRELVFHSYFAVLRHTIPSIIRNPGVGATIQADS